MQQAYPAAFQLNIFNSKYLFKNLHMNRFLETIVVFFVVAIVLSTLEALGGVFLEKIFGVNYFVWLKKE